MDRAKCLLMVVLAVAVVAGPCAAQEQFSRERFLSAVATPLATLTRNAEPRRDAFGRSVSAPMIHIDEYKLQSAPWSDLIEIPELAILTDGKRAGYLLGMAYLASRDLGIPIQNKNLGTYVIVKADGVFVANAFVSGFQGRRVTTDFQNFKTAAITVLEKAAVGECEFSSGWYRNDAREIQFLKRTCVDLQEQTRAAVQRASPTVASMPGKSIYVTQAPPTGSDAAPSQPSSWVPPSTVPNHNVAEAITKPAISPEARALEVKRRSEMSLSEWKARMAQINAEESSLSSALTRNAGMTTSPKFNRAYADGLAADRNAERQRIEARLAIVREDKELQEAARPIVEARAQQIEEANRRLEAEEAARKKLARDQQMDRFEASPRGAMLYSVIRANFLTKYLQQHPNPLPSERATGESAAKLIAKCVTRNITHDPDNISADEKAAIDMIIAELPQHGTIRNHTVAEFLASTILQCTVDCQNQMMRAVPVAGGGCGW